MNDVERPRPHTILDMTGGHVTFIVMLMTGGLSMVPPEDGPYESNFRDVTVLSIRGPQSV